MLFIKKIVSWGKNNKDFSVPFLLILIGVVSHFWWFVPGNSLFAFDTMWFPDDLIRSFADGGKRTFSSFLNFGDPDIQIYFNLPFFLWGFFGSQLGHQLAIMIPIVLLSILSPYYLLRYLFKSELIAFFGALFFAFSTPNLVGENTHLFIVFVNTLAPFLLLLFIRLKDKPSLIRAVIFGTVFAIGMAYELRIMLIASFILFLYSLIVFTRKEWKNLIGYLLISILVALGLSLFWILPTLQIDFSYIADLTDRPVFGKNFYKIENSWTLFDAWWHWSYGLKPFTQNIIPVFFWFIPILLFFPTIFSKWWNKGSEYYKNVLFFFILSLAGVFLTKQDNSPLSSLYPWLYNHIPGFNLFRVGVRFSVLTMIGYLGLFGFVARSLLNSLNEKKNGAKRNLILFFGFFFIVSFYNSIPLITQRAELFHPKSRPDEYAVLEKYLVSQPGFARTFWIPWEHEWGYFSVEKPKVRLNGSFLQSYGVLGDRDSGLQDLYALSEDRIKNLFDLAAIRNIIVLPDKDLVWFKGVWFNKYHVEELRKLSFLEEKIIVADQTFVLFENKSAAPLVFLTDNLPDGESSVEIEAVEHELFIPTRADLKIKGLKGIKYINLSYKNFPEWQARIGDFDWQKVLFNRGNELQRRASLEVLNTWFLDSAQLNDSMSGVKLNDDGSFDVDLTVYFRPEAYYFFGVKISVLVLLVVLVYFGGTGIYLFSKRR